MLASFPRPLPPTHPGLVLVLSLVLAGCGGIPDKQTTATGEAATEVQGKVEQAQTKASDKKEPRDFLTGDMVFETLAGELALQREDMPNASRHLLSAARLARDPLAAERAMKVALLNKDLVTAREAGALWVELEPEELNVHQLNVVLAMRSGDDDTALTHLERIVELGAEGESRGFLAAMTASLQDKDTEYADRLMARLVEAHPDEPEAMYVLALMATMTEHYPQASERVDRLLQMAPDLVRGIALKARILLAQERKDAAKAVLEDGIERAPGDSSLRAAYARMLLEMNDAEAAYEQYRKLLELNPKDLETVYLLGMLALQRDNAEDARTWFGQLYRAGVRRDDSAFYLGWTSEIGGDKSDKDLAEALDWYQKVESGSNHSEARKRIAIITARTDLDAAREILVRLRDEAADREAVIKLYLVEAELVGEYGSEQGVMALYDEALAQSPDNLDLLYSRAMYAISKDDLQGLERDLRRVIELDPKHTNALNALGYSLTDHSDRLEEALELINRAHELEPDSPAILDSMGWVRFHLGELEEARSYVEQALELSNDGEIASHLGEIYWTLGDQENARRIWGEALKREPDNEYLNKTLQRLLPEGGL